MFRDSADKAYKDGLISAETKHKYFQSVTENEVDLGILLAEKVNDRTLYFSRKFKNINYTDKITSMHIYSVYQIPFTGCPSGWFVNIY